MKENLAKYLDDEVQESGSTGQRFVARKQTRKINKPTSGWNGGKRNPHTPFRSRPKGDTGTGKKSSGARQRCDVGGCQAFASPAHSGYCSYHESQNLAVGERPVVLRSRECKIACLDCTGFCSPPRPGEDEPEYCDACIWAINHPEAKNEDDLDLDEL